MASKSHSNFWKWRQLHKPKYKIINKTKHLAEFYGTMLGDGCIEKFQRTDKMTISFNRKEVGHIKHIKKIITKLFGKQPTTRKRKDARCNDLYLYQKFISKRLHFPYGYKLDHTLRIPKWIKQKKLYLKHCFKGLFETDGDWTIDKKYGTNVIKFSNRSDSLLDDIAHELCKLGFHPQRRKIDTRLARQAEVYKFVKWIQFRKY